MLLNFIHCWEQAPRNLDTYYVKHSNFTLFMYINLLLGDTVNNDSSRGIKLFITPFLHFNNFPIFDRMPHWMAEGTTTLFRETSSEARVSLS